MQAVVSTPAAVRSPQGSTISTPAGAQGFGAKPASQSSAASSTTTTQASGAKTTFGGFTFTSTPIVKPGETPQDGKETAKPSTQFKLKESSIKVPSPSATVSMTAAATGEGAKPFAGFTFAPTKPAVSAFGSAVASTMSSGAAGSGSSAPSQTFVFGKGSPGMVSFASLSGQGTPEAFKVSLAGCHGFRNHRGDGYMGGTFQARARFQDSDFF